jgi:hypothetical protein
MSLMKLKHSLQIDRNKDFKSAEYVELHRYKFLSRKTVNQFWITLILRKR